MSTDEVEHRLFEANRAIDQMDEALVELREALAKVHRAMEDAKERGAWNS